MERDIDRFPAAPLSADGPATRLLRDQGLETVHEAVAYVRGLPYGRPSDPSDPLAVPVEGRGTCSTKHALVALACEEIGLDGVGLTLGVYAMTERNTPGVGPVLDAHDLDALPEAHCYLRAGGDRFDFTTTDDGAAVEQFHHEEPIRPDQIGDYKRDRHRAFLDEWRKREELDLELSDLWEIREACIAALSTADDRV